MIGIHVVRSSSIYICLVEKPMMNNHIAICLQNRLVEDVFRLVTSIRRVDWQSNGMHRG